MNKFQIIVVALLVVGTSALAAAGFLLHPSAGFGAIGAAAFYVYRELTKGDD